MFIPEHVVRPGWRTLLHNRTATRLTRRLQREAGVMVGSVPWQIHEGDPRAADPAAPDAVHHTRRDPHDSAL